MRPDVKLGAYTDYPFAITIDEINDASVDKVIEQLRDHRPRWCRSRTAAQRPTTTRLSSFIGRRDGEPVEGAQSRPDAVHHRP